MQRFEMIATDVIHGILDLSAMPGERVNATAVQASVLLRKKLARFATSADDVQPEPEPAPVVVVINHNLDEGVSVTINSEPIADAAKKPRRRRRSNTYKTRDMVAE